MTTEHPLLARIREDVLAGGAHSYLWGELRREVFPGEAAWMKLRAWCAQNAFECELAFGQSSRNAEVQVRKLDNGKAVVPAA